MSEEVKNEEISLGNVDDLPKEKLEEMDKLLDSMENNIPDENSTPQQQTDFMKEMMSALFGSNCADGNCQPPDFAIKFLKTNDKAVLPEYKSKKASGFDLATPEQFTLQPNETKVIDTGLKVADMPEGYEIQVRSRSGLAAKNGIFVLNSPGTIDNDYRGNLMVILHNANKEPKVFHEGDRIAQGIVAPYEQFPLKIVTEEELTKTERGDGGLGSTGA